VKHVICSRPEIRGSLVAADSGPRFAECFTGDCLCGLLMAVAIVASVLPAARAARIDVMQALRSE
jgi:hypothetical protein